MVVWVLNPQHKQTLLPPETPSIAGAVVLCLLNWRENQSESNTGDVFKTELHHSTFSVSLLFLSEN